MVTLRIQGWHNKVENGNTNFHCDRLVEITRCDDKKPVERVNIAKKLEMGQMVPISEYRDTIRYRYQTFKVSKYRSKCRLDSSIIYYRYTWITIPISSIELSMPRLQNIYGILSL